MKFTNKFYQLLLASLLLTGANSSMLIANTADNSEEAAELELDAISYPIFFATEYLNALWPVTGEDVQFLRDHAEELREELLFGLEQDTPQYMAAVQREFTAMLNRYEKFLPQFKKIVADFNASKAENLNLLVLVNHPETQRLLADLKQHCLNLKQLSLQRYPEAECPLMHKFLTNVASTLENLLAEGYAMLQAEGHKIMGTKKPLPALDEKRYARFLEMFRDINAAVQKLIAANITFNLTHKNLQAELFNAIIDVIKDDVVFNEFTHYMNMSDAPNPYLQAVEAYMLFEQDLAENKQNIPASLQQLIDVAAAYSQAQQEAMGAQLQQLMLAIQNIAMGNIPQV